MDAGWDSHQTSGKARFPGSKRDHASLKTGKMRDRPERLGARRFP
jgi:hypothetical protein